jgi:hypothetical protein
VSSPAPPRRGGALRGAAGATFAAAGGGIAAFVALIASGQLLGLIVSLLLRGVELEKGARIGLLLSLAAVRSEIVVTFAPPFPASTVLPAASLRSHLVPMVLTIGFVWMAARAGRRAARAWPVAPALARAVVAAAGAALPVVVAAALAANLVTLSFPRLHLTLAADAASAAIWAGVLAAVAAGTGAALEGGRGRPATDAIRGGVTAYLTALTLLIVAVLVVATVEPNMTRAYVDGLRGLGPAGAAWFGAHVVSLPAQSALLLVPASGSCLDVIAAGSTAARLCPWNLDATGSLAGALLPSDPLALAPSAWILIAAPPISAFLGGLRAGAGWAPADAIWRGVGSGLVFALLAMLGAMFASPQIAVPSLAGWVPLEIRAWSWTSAAVLGVWGIVGGTMGAWVAGRTYEEPGLPSPTSA